MRPRFLSVLALALLVILGAGCDKAPIAGAPAASADSSSPAADPPPAPAPASARALLGGLQAGDDLVGWKVEALTLVSEPPTKGALAIDLAQHDTKFTIWVAHKGQSSVRAPHATRDFEVFFGPREIEAAAVQAAVDRVLEQIKANEASVPAGGWF